MFDTAGLDQLSRNELKMLARSAAKIAYDFMRERDALQARLAAVEALPEKWRERALGWGVESYDECADQLEAALKKDSE